MKECIFCKIINGEIPSVKVYEDDDFVVIQDLAQNTKGHCLILPKKHSESILDMDSKLGCGLLKLIQKIGNAMLTGLNADGFNVGINTKPAAGQVIMHPHIHLIPRYDDDGLKHWKGHETSEEDRLLYAEKIIKEL